MQRSILLFICLICKIYTGTAQGRTDTSLERMIRTQASPRLLNILDHPDSFRYQIIYTRIDRDASNRPHFTNTYYRLDSNEYFNPASTVKMPLAFLALEKIHTLHRYGVDRDSPMLTDSADNDQPSLANYIKKIFLVSDNDAYNRLYEFLGQQHINERLHEMGYPSIRITRKFIPLTEEQNRHTGAIRFLKQADGPAIYTQSPAVSNFQFDFHRPVFIGNAYYNRYDSLIHSPMDFTRHNNVPLQDLRQILQSVLFPESVPASRRFRLTPEDYRFLYKYMSELPSESIHPQYDTTEFFDSYCKFWLFKAGRTKIPGNIRIFNKPGWSYGFLTDVAYIVDFKNKVEFMLSGVIYTNRDGILNDDKYEYDETGYPFFREVGEIIYHYELERKRTQPGFTEIQDGL